MRPHRSCGRRAGAHVALVVVIIASVLASVAGAAHALTTCGPGCVIANEDDYTVNFSASPATYTIDAAHGLLANDNGPTSTKVDLQDTVDDWASNPHLLTSDQG